MTCWTGFNLPAGISSSTIAQGHICYEATIKRNDMEPMAAH